MVSVGWGFSHWRISVVRRGTKAAEALYAEWVQWSLGLDWEISVEGSFVWESDTCPSSFDCLGLPLLALLSELLRCSAAIVIGQLMHRLELREGERHRNRGKEKIQSSALLLYIREQSGKGEGGSIYERSRSSRIGEAEEQQCVDRTICKAAETLYFIQSSYSTDCNVGPSSIDNVSSDNRTAPGR